MSEENEGKFVFQIREPGEIWTSNRAETLVRMLRDTYAGSFWIWYEDKTVPAEKGPRIDPRDVYPA